MCSETASPPTAAAWWATEAPVLPFLETVLTEGFKAGKRPLNVTLREAVEPGIPLLPGSVVPGSQRRRHTWKEMSDIGPAADFRGRGVGQGLGSASPGSPSGSGQGAGQGRGA